MSAASRFSLGCAATRVASACVPHARHVGAHGQHIGTRGPNGLRAPNVCACASRTTRATSSNCLPGTRSRCASSASCTRSCCRRGSCGRMRSWLRTRPSGSCWQGPKQLLTAAVHLQHAVGDAPERLGGEVLAAGRLLGDADPRVLVARDLLDHPEVEVRRADGGQVHAVQEAHASALVVEEDDASIVRCVEACSGAVEDRRFHHGAERNRAPRRRNCLPAGWPHAARVCRAARGIVLRPGAPAQPSASRPPSTGRFTPVR